MPTPYPKEFRSGVSLAALDRVRLRTPDQLGIDPEFHRSSIERRAQRQLGR